MKKQSWQSSNIEQRKNVEVLLMRENSLIGQFQVM